MSFLLGDVQGSATVTIAAGEPATAAVSRNAYAPYGVTRGGDHLNTDRGWLGQTEDATTGLTYLNARYYDPVLARFISPDPLLNPADPKTLDPYRYADNNPVLFTDASGMSPSCSGDTTGNCSKYSNATYNYATGKTVAKQNYENAKSGKSPVNKTTPKPRAHAQYPKHGVTGVIVAQQNKAQADQKAAEASVAAAHAQAIWNYEYAQMLGMIANQSWSAPATVNGIPQVDAGVCYNYLTCTVLRDAYNVSIMAASPSDYCDIGPATSMGVPSSASCTGNGAGNQLFTDANGTVRMGTTWDTLASGDQDRIAGSSVPGAGSGTGSMSSLGRPSTPKDSNAEGFAYTGEGLDFYGGGTYTSPDWVGVIDGKSWAGGTSHRCMTLYAPAAADVAGLSPGQVAAVTAYNQC